MDFYTAQELADILQKEGDAEMTLRKIRYYTQIGILPELEYINNKPRYTQKHLEHLRALRVMQKTGLKLDEIQTQLRNMDVGSVSNIANQSEYYSPQRLIETTTVYVNDDVSVIFSKNVSAEKQQEIVSLIQKNF